MIRFVRVLALCAVLLGGGALGGGVPGAQSGGLSPSAFAAGPDDIAASPRRGELPAPVADLRRKDARVLTLGYRLATGNAPFCERRTFSVGLLLHDMAAYGSGATLRTLLGLDGDIGVQALVPGGPAEAAGLRVDDTVLGIGEMMFAQIPSSERKPWHRIEAIRAQAERLLRETGTLPITIMRSGVPVTLTLQGVPACASRFEIGEGTGAAADGHRIVIGPDFAGVDYPDPLLAAVLAHEFAHNLLGHRAWHEANGGRKQATVRLTEREADRLMPWVLVNAGFEPRAASAFMRRWGPRHDGWIFRARSHDGWDERAEFIEAEFAPIEAARAADGTADWSRHFRREPLPEG